ncbi:substrate-binding domain-containing protein [Stakelama pacifica]|uniref:Phosphate ABC transporter substrate-binding protein (PhoT family) n=1 Tax=Stakelama pacifica TaxID=517720 RepID=A0A4R6FI29_9SPHN|nr:substrate-binding domain-containing protein [Stakelama pacifica]TDN81079.1 phosphate ABC transporter substrate-binding protein (PhoT family) [Stakelama pacifica]GGO96691.1 phosphate ABC transporter substrate-binding protein [Stakelama pacifica]
MYGRLTVIAATAIALTGCSQDSSRDYMKIVGSSTVYPFSTAVAEAMVNTNPALKTPVIESTGTGGGMKLFCGGVGVQHPDVEDASRRMTPNEFAACTQNGVNGIMEIQVGMDGVALAESKKGPKLELTRADIYKALAANPMGKPQTAKFWSDVNPSLPHTPIQVFGPPSTSGTRDALAELILAKGCKEVDPQAAKLEETDKDAFKERCQRIREDGAYVDKGENDNIIVQNLTVSPNAVGIFGYSYLEENRDRLNGVPINGVAATYENIADRSYPGARPLFIYVKKQHLNAVPGMKQFLNQYSQMWGPDGPLVAKGMIAAPADVRANSEKIIEQGITITADTLKDDELH